MLLNWVRMLAALVGIVVVFVGLWASVRVFQDILGLFTAPDALKASISGWVEAVGGEDRVWEVQGNRLEYGAILGVAAFVVCKLILAWLSVSMLVGGAKMISWTAGDQEAVKRLLRETLPSSRQGGN